MAGDTNAAALLLQQSADIDGTDDRGLTPLHVAAAHGQVAMIDWLLDYGATKNPYSAHAGLPLHLAAQQEHGMPQPGEDCVMIAKHEMVGVLLGACPSFLPKWEAFQEYWGGEADDLQYLALADFARHLIRLLERGETAGFPTAFEAIERLHVEGEHCVKEAATVGLLEALQNENLHTATRPEQFQPFLGPETARWWDKLYRFWEHGELLTDD